jgi:peroxiredoxin (alkyl hydroperoxide reductase subunit C)
MANLINTEVKPFKATAYHNGKFIDVSDADLKGKWSVVFFYPADFTFVCPTELGDLADNYAEFKKMGVEIYSVSTDTHFTHKAWHDTSDTIKKIQYPMIGDPTGLISRNFEVMIEEAGLAERGTFVIDPAGKIQIIEVNAGGIGRDASELLRKVKAAQYVAAHRRSIWLARSDFSLDRTACVRDPDAGLRRRHKRRCCTNLLSEISSKRTGPCLMPI